MARQHRGPSNGPPSPDDEAALEELLSALATGAHPIDGKAIAPRDGDGYGDAYDWRRPGAVERAFTAWAPFLPKGIVGDGLAGLAAEMRSQSEAPFVGHAQRIRRNGNAAAPRPGSGGGPARVMLDEFHFVEQHNAAAERRRSEAEDMLGGAQGPRMVG